MVIRALGRRRVDPAAVRTAEDVRTLAVLLQAGTAPLTAWRHLAESGVDVARLVVDDAARGRSLPDAIRRRGGAWVDVASAWGIAATVGAPLGEVLRVIADALDDAASVADEVRVALAEPAGTARLMLWLPAAGLLLGAALGFDALGVLLTHPIGIGCLVGGLGLILLARMWTRALIRRAQPVPGVPGMRTELVAVALAGGASVARALAVTDDEVGEGGDRAETDGAAIARVLRLSEAAGVPAVELLRADAARARREERTRGRIAAAGLSTRLLLPLGVCTLPSFLLLGVAPLILGVITSTSLPVGG